MAKTYAAELLIKNKDALKSLEQVAKKVKQVKKELDKPIDVDVKLGSSFKNIETKINKIAPKEKTIKITATEDVTKTMNNVQRNMFEMSNKMNSSLTSSMKGFTSSLSASLPKLQAMSNTMAAVSNTSKLASSIANATAASGLAGAGAGLAGAAVLGGKGKDGKDAGEQIGSDIAEGTGNSIIDRLKNLGARIRNTAISLGKKFSKGFADAIGESKKRINGITQRIGNIDISTHGIFADDGSALADMIQRQKDALYDLGVDNPLKNWEMNDVGFFREWNSKIGDMASKFQSFSQKIKSIMNKAGESIKSKWNNNHMRIMASWTKEALTEAFQYVKIAAIPKIQAIGKSIKIWATQAKFACQRMKYFFDYFISKALIGISRLATNIGSKLVTAFKKVMTPINSIKTAISSVMNRVSSMIPTKIKTAFSKVGSVAKNAASKAYSAFSKMATKAGSAIIKGLGNAFNRVKTIASSTAKWVAGAFGGAMAFGVKDMSTQEDYITSMTHFISVDDAKKNGKNTITMQGAKERADELFNWGTEFANKTPFQNADVYSAINRMTQVFGYGTDGAQIQKMTKLVGDMAALNPGKTMGDAAEAIADLALGETERMKEFGFKISQDELKALAGAEGQDEPLTQEQIMKAFEKMTSSGGALFETFDGGADAMANTLSGKFSTVMGKFRQMMVDSMKPFENIFKGVLDNISTALGGDFKTKFVDTFKTVASFIEDLMAGDSSTFPIIQNLINAFNTLKGALEPVFDTIIGTYKKMFDSASENFGGVGGIIEGFANAVAGAINGIKPAFDLVLPIFSVLQSTVQAVWPVVQGIIETGAQIIGDVIKALQPVFGAIDQVIQVLGGTVANIWPQIQETITNVWNNLQPVLELFGNLAQLIADVFQVAWPPIAGVVETLWGIIGPILEGISKVLGTIADLANKAFDGINKVKESKLNPANWFGGKDGQKAYGQNRVPYDGYRASLHEGERVLTARQAAQMDAGLLPGQRSSNNNNITINVSGTTDPDTTARMVVQRLKETLENTPVKSFA